MAKFPRYEEIAGKPVFVTPKGRASYPFLFAPQADKKGGKARYKVELLFDKEDEAVMEGLNALQKACKKLAAAAFGKEFALSKKCKLPIKDGDEKEDKPEYENCFYISPWSYTRPNVVGPDKSNLEPGDFYGGCYARVSLTPFCFDVDGSKGVGLALQNVQKMADGDKFGGGATRKADEDFDVVEEEDTPFDDTEDDLGL